MNKLSDEQLRFHILEIVAKYSETSSLVIWYELSEKIISFIKTGKYPIFDTESASDKRDYSKNVRIISEMNRYG